MDLHAYNHIRSGGSGYFTALRGLIAVWGKEAVQFLDGMITNDMKTLEDGQQMLAAFPNAQGRLLAVVRLLRDGDRYLIETDVSMHEKVFQNLFRFTFAGDFFVEDISNHFYVTAIWGASKLPSDEYLAFSDKKIGNVMYRGEEWRALPSVNGGEIDLWVPATQLQEYFIEDFHNAAGAVDVSDSTYEVIRIEAGIPKYGVDMDETTIVPELGLDGLISYTKGCYIGQEIIARIHFRGHVAKQLTGLVLESSGSGFVPGAELRSNEGKNAGKIASVTYSAKLNKQIALGYVRYEFLKSGTVLNIEESTVRVADLPFI